MKTKKDSLMNHVKIAILPLRCSDCHKIIWPFDAYVIGLMPHVGRKKLCTKGNNCCASNYTLLESKSDEGTYFLERTNNEHT